MSSAEARDVVTEVGVIRPPPSLPELRWRDLIGFPPRATSWKHLPNSRRVRLAFNGRAAIHQYFVSLASTSPKRSRRVVLVPAFHCPTVVDPIIHAGYTVRYFAVDPDLKVA